MQFSSPCNSLLELVFQNVVGIAIFEAGHLFQGRAAHNHLIAANLDLQGYQEDKRQQEATQVGEAPGFWNLRKPILDYVNDDRGRHEEFTHIHELGRP